MCGIVGKVSLGTGAEQVTAPLVKRMVQTLHHRGPDDQGVYVAADGRAGIGIARLSIIDLQTGHQPMSNEDGTLHVVVNGEIYNYRELRETLAPRHRFTTRSDTEVLVHLYEEHGDDMLDHLRGMFAFALWDERKKRLLLARDRVGQKPLYVAHDAGSGTLTFGSEIKALLEDASVSRELDPLALDDYLTYAFVPTPRSIYRAIRKLPAGSRGILDHRGWRVERYWSVDYAESDVTDESAALDRFDELLTESVRLRMISDVPLGGFLSGGIDSGMITAIMSKLHSEPVRTFTIGFPRRDYNEIDDAGKTADILKTRHTEQVVDWNLQAMVPLLAGHFDEPFGDSSAVPTYHVCKTARQHVTVALSGDGGDELLAGYNRYQAHKLASIYNRVPRLLGPAWIEAVVKRLPTTTRYFGKSAVKSAQYFVEFAEGLRRREWQSWLLYFDDTMRERLYSPAARDRLEDARRRTSGDGDDPFEEIVERASRLDGVHRVMWIDLMTYLPDDILVKVDRMSMAVSLECRAPFLDHRLIEWLATVPVGLKLRGLKRKYLLHRLAERYFPKGTFDRPKQGFMMPLAVWLRGSLGDWILARLAGNARFTEMFSMPVVEELLGAHRAARNDHSYRLWALLMLGEFLRMPACTHAYETGASET